MPLAAFFPVPQRKTGRRSTEAKRKSEAKKRCEGAPVEELKRWTEVEFCFEHLFTLTCMYNHGQSLLLRECLSVCLWEQKSFAFLLGTSKCTASSLCEMFLSCHCFLVWNGTKRNPPNHQIPPKLQTSTSPGLQISNTLFVFQNISLWGPGLLLRAEPLWGRPKKAKAPRARPKLTASRWRWNPCPVKNTQPVKLTKTKVVGWCRMAVFILEKVPIGFWPT